ncbi:MAG: NAD-dependent epimerase/dehydratase family protein [Actinomycetia bacterium]|nr:NAD-dependent epimerase/dehydratase family protein [Actinomycetes bacterium]MCP4227999.1 NAD-dependent epimerase/dehydratase family protein [Actinomycetes bacterium]MCP5032325.1 NAD-dependent epimerase/dehydratase family protein [Actinomycetes bacterium]
MRALAVTGAAGSVGRRVVELLAAEPGVGTIRAFDRIGLVSNAEVDFCQVDLADPGTPDLFAGCDTIVHLADDPRRRHDPMVAATMLERVLDGAEQVGCPHFVLLSSALVYGAYPTNPIPLTEHHHRRPNPGLAYAVGKARLEGQAQAWAERTGADLAILRPTATLSERGASYIAGTLRTATSIRPEHVDAPVQFLHHDDLALAVTLVAAKRMKSIYNVAPDGWIGPDVFRDLLAEAELRWPEPVDEAYGRLTRAVHQRRMEAGIAPYIDHSWVIANDRLRAAGWDPAFSNEEAFVLGTPPPWWRAFSSRRRQELALGAVGVATAGAVAGVGLAARWLIRDR